MSHQLIGRSPALKKLRDEGYGVEIRAEKYLLVHPVPYVNAKKEIADGTLVCELNFAGNEVIAPANHVMHFIGEYPCDMDGQPLTKIFNASNRRELTAGLFVDHTFSAKPVGRGPYVDFFEKVKTYVAKITSHAERIDEKATAKTFRVVEMSETESPFKYPDTASSRAEIDAVTGKLARGRIGIIGLGGTGAYVLDLVAKTPVDEIHVFDGDWFSQHNAFRGPGAASAEQLNARPKKVAYWVAKYEPLRHRLFGHDAYVDENNVGELLDMDFVFLCIDRGPARKLIAETLNRHGKPFIDVGMGLVLGDGALGGLVRTTTVTATKSDHMESRLPYGESADNEYIRNIQIADLNALNAAFAVIKWKKLWGFYGDFGREHFSSYSVGTNEIANEDCL